MYSRALRVRKRCNRLLDNALAELRNFNQAKSLCSEVNGIRFQNHSDTTKCKDGQFSTSIKSYSLSSRSDPSSYSFLLSRSKHSVREFTAGESFLFCSGVIHSLPASLGIRSFSDQAESREQDYEDVRVLIKKRLAEMGQVDSEVDANLQVLEILLKHRTSELDSDAVKTAAEKLKPAALYTLASTLYSLQEMVGEEAVFLAAPLFRIAAVRGDPNAKYSFGQLLRTGLGGVKPDPKEAATLFTELAKQGHPYAQFSLAGMYYAGLGVKQDFEVAYTLYKVNLCAKDWKGPKNWRENEVHEVSAESGVHQGYNMIGNMYLNGQGVDSDDAKAVECFKTGAEKGDSTSLVSLARCFSLGKGVAQDLPKAFSYHKEAAEKGNVVAVYNLGTHYFAGKGVELDLKKAAEYFKIASDKNFTLAQINLGNMFYHGLGVEKNLEKARELYKKAAPSNHNARMLLEELESEMHGTHK